jgi:RNA polymerase sigma-70 factor (ECF subfamily)
VEAELIRADAEAAVHRLVDALPLELRLPLALSTVDGLTSPEIARVMGIPEGTVRGRMARAREILKRKLHEAEVRRGR